jgi:hypothetical protein
MTIVPWKKETFTQLLPSVQLNKNTTIITPYNLRKAGPLKLYRKEIALFKPHSKSSRLGITIKAFESPNGYSISNSTVTSDFILTLNKKETGLKDNCSSTNIYFNPQENALKRIRRSGIIKGDYSVDHTQYLNSRKISFQQNTFHYENDNVIYKPNNDNFACEGAVSSSSFLLRKKFNTIRTNTNKLLKPYGPAVSNAMAYGIADSISTYKNKFAFPTKLTPTFKKYSDVMLCSRHITR